jgi:hypothetical protein
MPLLRHHTPKALYRYGGALRQVTLKPNRSLKALYMRCMLIAAKPRQANPKPATAYAHTLDQPWPTRKRTNQTGADQMPIVVVGPVSKCRRAALGPIRGDHLLKKGVLERIHLLPEKTSGGTAARRTLSGAPRVRGAQHHFALSGKGG